MARWRNWSGRVRARPRQLLKPRDETDLAARIAIAPAPVRAVGSGHSFTALGQSEGTIALLDAMRGVTAIDTRRREATVLAGTTIRELGEPLAEAGLALANQGDIDAQTIAGAVATVGLAAVFLVLFLRAVKQGQFDDLDDPPKRILEDD